MNSLVPIAVSGWRAAPRSVRYLFVGAVCAALNNLLLIAAVTAGFHYSASLCLACLPMLVVGYFLHIKVTFDAAASIGSFLRYSLAVIASYPVWIASLFILCDLWHVTICFAGPIATTVVFATNYVNTHWAIERSLRVHFHGKKLLSLSTRALS